MTTLLMVLLKPRAKSMLTFATVSIFTWRVGKFYVQVGRVVKPSVNSVTFEDLYEQLVQPPAVS